MKKFFVLFTIALFTFLIVFLYKVNFNQKVIATNNKSLPPAFNFNIKQPNVPEPQVTSPLPKVNITDKSKSIEPTVKAEEQPKFNNRYISGNIPTNINDLEFINSINPDWKNNLARNLMHFLPEDSKISITHEKEVIKFFGKNKAQYAELVLVETTLPNQRAKSYHALIDSLTSKVLLTWDFDRKEF